MAGASRSTSYLEGRPYRAVGVGIIAALTGLALMSTGYASLDQRLHQATGRGYAYRGVDANPLWLLGAAVVIGGVGLLGTGVLRWVRGAASARPETADVLLGGGVILSLLLCAAAAPGSSSTPVRVSARPVAPNVVSSPHRAVALAEVGPAAPDVSESSPPDEHLADVRNVQMFVQQYAADIRACRRDPAAPGARAIMELELDTRGSLRSTGVTVDLPGAAPATRRAVTRCIESVFSNAHAPPAHGEPVHVRVPFSL